MGALPKPLEPRIKKPVVSDATPPKRDQFGRDPDCPSERLRTQTDYEADTGYAPLYHAALADLPRLSSGAVCYAFVLVVNMLSYGRGKQWHEFQADERDDSKCSKCKGRSSDGVHSKPGVRYDSTLPISPQALADLCRANIRDIQRQLAELAERGMIKAKQVKRGEYVIS